MAEATDKPDDDWEGCTMGADPDTQAFLEGYEAFEEGRPRDAAPKESPKRELWVRGWEQAETGGCTIRPGDPDAPTYLEGYEAFHVRGGVPALRR